MGNIYSFTKEKDTTTIITIVSKEFNYQGYEAIYNFNVIIAANMTYPIGTIVTAVFSSFASPKINHLTSASCYEEGISDLNCYPIDERKVQFSLIKQWSGGDNINNYNFSIAGVSQSPSLDSFGKIYFSFDSDTDYSNGILYKTDLPDLAP